MEGVDEVEATKIVETARAELPVYPQPQPVAKVVLSLDPLLPLTTLTQSSRSVMDHQFTMEMLGSEPGNLPKIYSLNMSEDIVPMCDFSETPQGRVAVERKVEHEFDMRPNSDSIEDYRRLCRERTNKSMIKNHEIQDNKKTPLVKQSEVKRT